MTHEPKPEMPRVNKNLQFIRDWENIDPEMVANECSKAHIFYMLRDAIAEIKRLSNLSPDSELLEALNSAIKLLRKGSLYIAGEDGYEIEVIAILQEAIAKHTNKTA